MAGPRTRELLLVGGEPRDHGDGPQMGVFARPMVVMVVVSVLRAGFVWPGRVQMAVIAA
jgi:hypothetical protein